MKKKLLLLTVICVVFSACGKNNASFESSEPEISLAIQSQVTTTEASFSEVTTPQEKPEYPVGIDYPLVVDTTKKDLTDEEIISFYKTVKVMAYTGGYFKWADGHLLETTTGESISEFIDRYRLVFTNEYCDKNITGWAKYFENYKTLWLSYENTDEGYSLQDGYLYFNDIEAESNYMDYTEICLAFCGGGGWKFEDYHTYEILQRAENKIVFRVYIAPDPALKTYPEEYDYVVVYDVDYDYSISADEENTLRILGTYEGYDAEKQYPIIGELPESGEIITLNELFENYKSHYTLVWETTEIYYEDGRWRFNNMPTHP
jgi:hypothetical protein